MVTGFFFAFLAVAYQVHASGGENISTSISHISVYGFGTDFSARVIHHAIFQVGYLYLCNAQMSANHLYIQYDLDVAESAEIVYNAIPVEGVECGWKGDFTGGDCALLFQTQVHNTPGSELEVFAGRRRASVLTDDDLDIDFSVSGEFFSFCKKQRFF
jgi:hypothetical protein